MVKVKQMQNFHTWVIFLINQSEESEEIGEKQHSVFGSRGGQISPLMHVALCICVECVLICVIQV